MERTVAIIGAGSVGSTIASYLVWSGVYSEIYMIDIDKNRCEGEVMDLSDASFVTSTVVKVGTWQDAKKASMIIITAGAKQRQGETRRALLQRNVRILRAIANSILPVSSYTNILLVANPVDILTQLFQEISGIPKSRVFGSGTYLDSMRLREALAEKVKVAPKNIHAYVVGMHGDLQVPLWSLANVAGCKASEYARLSKTERKQLAEDTKNKAYKIIKAKGSTYYGIAACVAKLSRAISGNHREVFQLSVWSEDYGSYLSWPALVGSKGILRSLPLSISKQEREVVLRAAKHIRDGVSNALGNDRISSKL